MFYPLLKLSYRLGSVAYFWNYDVSIQTKCFLMVGIPLSIDFLYNSYVYPYVILGNINSQQDSLREMMTELVEINQLRYRQLSDQGHEFVELLQQDHSANVELFTMIKDPLIENTKHITQMKEILITISQKEESITSLKTLVDTLI